MNTHAPDKNAGGPQGLPVIRPEAADGGDAGEIRSMTAAAFDGIEQSDGHEPAIIDALRDADALTLSLVAVRSGWVIGHIAASPVTLSGDDAAEGAGRWFGLGPLSVSPAHQGEGIGAALMRAALELLDTEHGAAGAVLLGDPTYYDRFGFEARDGLTMEGLPDDHAAYFQALRLDGESSYPRAVVSYHPAFGA
ncbi:N-acetyltransferase [Corynebacterium sp. USCH3]|uniref:GNAT family N-acetyltransferase n=1 Tax=Corynebacterium sp. USCH3 TaxID=3024840 RepID=UPI0030B56517